MKKTIVIAAPVTTRSGYGTHARMICRALLKLQDKYELKILPTRWGSTPLSADVSDLQPYFHLGQLTQQPDIFIVVSIPSEMQRVGKFNILITAGTESSVCNLKFVEGCNKADLIITPSEFTKTVLKETVIEKKNQQNQVVETIKVDRPLEVLFEGVDTNVFNKNDTKPFDLKQVKEDFCFLFVGSWLGGVLGEDRKNVGALVKVFYDTFKRKGGTNRPALILKTNGAGFSEVEYADIVGKLKMIGDSIDGSGLLPSVYVINGDLTDNEMNDLYNHPKVKAMISLTHAEGYGLPLSEFTTTGKPVITCNYSGPVDFLSKDHGAVLLPGSITKIHDSAANEWIVKGSDWFTPNYAFTSQIMNDVYERYDKYLEKSRKHVKYTKDNFSFDKMVEKFDEILTKYVPEKPQTIKLNLPKLQKVSE
jgi:glycosyltransferase involved in cell wall biosynthesis